MAREADDDVPLGPGDLTALLSPEFGKGVELLEDNASKRVRLGSWHSDEYAESDVEELRAQRDRLKRERWEIKRRQAELNAFKLAFVVGPGDAGEAMPSPRDARSPWCSA